MSPPGTELHARLHEMKKGELLTARLCRALDLASPWCTYLPLICLSTTVVCGTSPPFITIALIVYSVNAYCLLQYHAFFV
jgi:hypothetical protein